MPRSFCGLARPRSHAVDCAHPSTPLLFCVQGAKGPAAGQTKEAKMRAAMSGGKGKKKKWSKGKVKDKILNKVLYDDETYAKLMKEVPKFKLISLSVLSDRLKVRPPATPWRGCVRFALSYASPSQRNTEICSQTARRIPPRECSYIRGVQSILRPQRDREGAAGRMPPAFCLSAVPFLFDPSHRGPPRRFRAPWHASRSRTSWRRARSG